MILIRGRSPIVSAGEFYQTALTNRACLKYWLRSLQHPRAPRRLQLPQNFFKRCRLTLGMDNCATYRFVRRRFMARGSKQPVVSFYNIKVLSLDHNRVQYVLKHHFFDSHENRWIKQAGTIYSTRYEAQ